MTYNQVVASAAGTITNTAVLLVDAKNEQAHEFYGRYGFVQVEDASNRMFLPMKTVEQLLNSSD